MRRKANSNATLFHGLCWIGGMTGFIVWWVTGNIIMMGAIAAVLYITLIYYNALEKNTRAGRGSRH